MIRQIHDRAKPEANLANNLALTMTVNEVVQTRVDAIAHDAAQMGERAARFWKFLGIGANEQGDTPSNAAAYQLPNRISGVEFATLDVLSQQFTSTPGFNGMASRQQGPPFVLLPYSYSIRINGRTRRTVSGEPVLGVHDKTRRYSGFAFSESKDSTCIERSSFTAGGHVRVGKIQRFIITSDRALFVLVHTWEIINHQRSRLKLITAATSQQCILPAEQLGPVVVFAPWTENDGKASINRIDKSMECVMLTRDHPL